ncbi:MAG TPA: hypothetical protein VMI12_15180 [Puia sp.]|nr:hypothetical protein [Puia sp.]
MKKPFVLFMGIGCFASCHKTEISPDNGWTWFGTSNPVVYNYVLINANQVTTKADTNEFHIAIAAAFIDSNSNKLTGVDDLSVNNKAINRNVDSTYSYDYGEQSSLNEGLALYGTNVSITIKGCSNADTATKTVYLPRKLINVVSDFPDAIDASGDLSLKWAVDPANIWGHVIIQVYYYAGLSHSSDSTMPEQINTLNYTVADNGSYTIKSKDLNIYPVKSYIGISIARGTQSEVVLPISKKRVFYFSNSSASTPPLIVNRNN